MNMNWKKVLDTAVLVIKATGIIIKHFAIWFGKVFGTLLLVGGVAGIIMGFLFMGYVNKYIIPEASIDLGNFDVDLTSTIYATDPDTGNDVVLTTLHGSQNRVWADYDEIPQDMVNAAIAIEDERFRTHAGVDWKRTLGAFTNMFLGSRSNFGGSTITQQLIKNITGNDEVTVKRKILEIFSALEFEKKYDKDHIMEWYLNASYFGQGCNGVKNGGAGVFR